MMKTRIGDGLALNLAGKKPTIMLAGRPAKAALGFERIDGRHEDTKLGISTGGWVAIGAGIVAAAAVGFALWVDEIDDHSD
jgi:hypothetical protein